jgi:hypothetical protein
MKKVNKMPTFTYSMGRRGRDRLIVGFTTTIMQSMSITTNVVSLNPTHAIRLYYIKTKFGGKY